MTSFEKVGTAAALALVEIDSTTRLNADLITPRDPVGIVLLVHGSGSSRLSPRNQFVARTLRDHGLATMLLDIESWEERQHRDIEGTPHIGVQEMARRIVIAARGLQQERETAGLPLGYLGAGSGAAAALIAAAQAPEIVHGVVARGGRLELAGDCLPQVRAPALLIVGARDNSVVHHNRDAIDRLGSSVKQLEIIPGAHHLFEEPGTLAAAAIHASAWLARHLSPLPTHAVVYGEQ